MKIDVLTLFPEYFNSPLQQSLLKRALENGCFSFYAHQLRNWASPPHFQVDDKSFGGGPGMVLMPEPLKKGIESLKGPKSKVIYLSPQGTPLTQNKCKELAKQEHLILLCGHYEGIDERIIQAYVDEEISIGDFVMTNGAPAALCLIDSVVRLIPNVVGKEQSIFQDSFEQDLFDHPHYTIPQNFEGMQVPEILLSGHHQQIEAFRKEKAEQKTKERRPDLYQKYLNKQVVLK